MNEIAKPLEQNPYVGQLTSLRGIACMVVLIGHVIQVVNYHASYTKPNSLLVRMFTGAFNAEGAVLVFFVLSGCVLSLSLRNTRRFARPALFGFYVRRVFRLYPLLWVSFMPAMLSMIVGMQLAKAGVFSDWLNGNLLSAISIKHSLLSVCGLYTRYNGPMWSLRVELICSALFPAIFLLIKDLRYRVATLVLLTIIALLPVPHRFGVSYGLSFAVGALIPMLPHRKRRLDIALVWTAFLALVYDRLALGSLNPPDRIFDLIETAAAFVVIRDIFTAGQRYRFLMAPPVVKLGEISFSVYLLHLPIFLILFTLASRIIGVAPLLDHPALTQTGMSLLTIAATVPLSLLTYRLVELPMHNFGRRLGRRVAGRAAAIDPAFATPVIP